METTNHSLTEVTLDLVCEMIVRLEHLLGSLEVWSNDPREDQPAFSGPPTSNSLDGILADMQQLDDALEHLIAALESYRRRLQETSPSMVEENGDGRT